jgi:hypothetical protein
MKCVLDLSIVSGLQPWCNFSGKSSTQEMHFTLLIASCRKGSNRLFDAIYDRLSQH